VKQYKHLLAALLLCCFIFPATNVHTQADLPVVRAVLFFSPACGHCELVINETLLPMIDQYGEQLQIVALDVTQRQGQALFHSSMQYFGLEQAGVPFLVIGDMYLIGSADIPEQFPGLVETYLGQGGVDWPGLPGLSEALQTSKNTTESTPAYLPVVQAVLFYRSACSHCQKLTEQVIPPLLEKYGAQLEIFGIDVSTPEGEAVYQAAIDGFKIEKIGVPTLVLGDHVLIGTLEIQERFATTIEGYFKQGGMEWPDIAGLQEAILEASEADVSSGASSPSETDAPITAAPGIPGVVDEPSGWLDRFRLDPAGNTLSVVVLIGMIGSVGWVATLFQEGSNVRRPESGSWIIPLLCVIGLGVAGYLAYVETSQATAVCGPVGDCNTVQQSEYARLFGILPVGVLGLAGYIVILIAWLFSRNARATISTYGSLSLLVLTFSGTLFSIYLTFLEPFVIGATCIWCLTSAVLTTTLLLLSAGPGRAAFLRMRSQMFL
jgi:uncharacterized membrane protein/thiol-disulfide isomerase/thioredoxin